MRYEELITLLKTANTVEEIDASREEIAGILPQVRIMFDYDQKNHAHQYDLWMHSLHTVVNLPRGMEDDMLYLAALLHDIGKPDCCKAGTKPGDTNMHYYGHPDRSAEIVQEEILSMFPKKGILLSTEEQTRLLYYVRHHDDHVNLKLKYVREHLKWASIEEFKKLMLLEVADAKAHVMIPVVRERAEVCEKLSGSAADDLFLLVLAGK